MVRDVNLLRRLLLDAEAAQDAIMMRNETERQHATLLVEAGLVETVDQSVLRERRIFIARITWKGYEFLDAVRDDTTWSALIGQVGTAAPLEVVNAVAMELAAHRTREAVSK